MAKKYVGVSVHCGDRPFYHVTEDVVQLVTDRFPSAEKVGSGMMIGGPPIRDIEFLINYASADKVAPFLKEQGYTLE